MIINDPVWGETRILDPVLQELINSRDSRRLFGISQLGLPQEFHFLTTFPRGAHAVGSMMLVDRMGGSRDEQIASFIHDHNHTAFSHVIDWVKGSEERDDFQDLNHADYLQNSETALILKKHDLDIEDYLDESKFPIAEQETPRLCADRVDYGLREMLISGFAQDIVSVCAESLTTFDGRMVFKDSKSARLFGWGFVNLWDSDWNNRESLGKFLLFSNLLREAMGRGIINMEDWYIDDQHMINLLSNSGDEDIIDRLNHLHLPLDENPDLHTVAGTHGPHKFRWVDPEFLVEGGKSIKKLTEVNDIYAKAIERRMNEASKGFDI